MEGNLNPFSQESFPSKQKHEKVGMKREIFDNRDLEKVTREDLGIMSPSEKEDSKKKILLRHPIKKVKKGTPNAKGLKKLAMSSLFQETSYQRANDEIFLRLLPKSDNTLRIMMFIENFPRLELTVSPKISLKKILEHLNTKWFCKYPGKFAIDLYPDSTKWLQSTQLETLNSSRKFEPTILSENYLIHDIMVAYNSHQDKVLYVYYEIKERISSSMGGISATSNNNTFRAYMAPSAMTTGMQKPMAQTKSAVVIKTEIDEKSRQSQKITQMASINSTSNHIMNTENGVRNKISRQITAKHKPPTPGGLSVNSNMPDDGILSLSMKSDGFGRLINNNTQGYSNQHFSNQVHHNNLNSNYMNINDSFSKVVGFDNGYEEAEYYDSLRKGISKGSPLELNQSPVVTPRTLNGSNIPKADVGDIHVAEKPEAKKATSGDYVQQSRKDNKSEGENDLKPAADEAATHSKSEGQKGSSHEKSNSSFTFNNENSQQQPRQQSDSRSAGGGFFGSNFRILNERSKSQIPAEFLHGFSSKSEAPNLLNIISPSLKHGDFMKNNQFQKIVGIIDKVGQDFESNGSQNSLKPQDPKPFNTNSNQPKPVSIHRKNTK